MFELLPLVHSILGYLHVSHRLFGLFLSPSSASCVQLISVLLCLITASSVPPHHPPLTLSLSLSAAGISGSEWAGRCRVAVNAIKKGRGRAVVREDEEEEEEEGVIQFSYLCALSHEDGWEQKRKEQRKEMTILWEFNGGSDSRKTLLPREKKKKKKREKTVDVNINRRKVWKEEEKWTMWDKKVSLHLLKKDPTVHLYSSSSVHPADRTSEERPALEGRKTDFRAHREVRANNQSVRQAYRGTLALCIIYLLCLFCAAVRLRFLFLPTSPVIYKEVTHFCGVVYIQDSR